MDEGWLDAGGEQQRGARWQGADGGGPLPEGSAAVIGVFAEGDRLTVSSSRDDRLLFALSRSNIRLVV